MGFRICGNRTLNGYYFNDMLDDTADYVFRFASYPEFFVRMTAIRDDNDKLQPAFALFYDAPDVKDFALFAQPISPKQDNDYLNYWAKKFIQDCDEKNYLYNLSYGVVYNLYKMAKKEGFEINFEHIEPPTEHMDEDNALTYDNTLTINYLGQDYTVHPYHGFLPWQSNCMIQIAQQMSTAELDKEVEVFVNLYKLFEKDSAYYAIQNFYMRNSFEKDVAGLHEQNVQMVLWAFYRNHKQANLDNNNLLTTFDQWKTELVRTHGVLIIPLDAYFQEARQFLEKSKDFVQLPF